MRAPTCQQLCLQTPKKVKCDIDCIRGHVKNGFYFIYLFHYMLVPAFKALHYVFQGTYNENNLSKIVS